MAVNIQGNQIVSTASKPNIDADYGPYTGGTLQEALNNAESALKYKKSEGKTIGIKVGTNSIIEYWYKLGTNNELNLTEKTPDLSSKQDVITDNNPLDADLVDDSNSTNKFVSSTEKTIWNGKQNALNSIQLTNIDKGGTALQPSSTSGLLKNDGTVDTETQTKAANAIQMPDGATEEKVLGYENGAIKWVPKPSNGQDGEDGLSAFQLAQQEGFSGDINAWLASLKANIGAFKFVATESAALSFFNSIGDSYNGTIDDVTASVDTKATILLMNDANPATKTMMITTEDDGNGGYIFVYAGNLNNAISSNVLTENSVDNTKLANPKSNDLAKAKDVMDVKQMLGVGVTLKETKVQLVENTNWFANYKVDATGKIVTTAGTPANAIFIYPVTGYKRVRVLGGISSSSTFDLGYGFTAEPIDTSAMTNLQLDVSSPFIKDADTSGKYEYIIDVPTGMNYLVFTIYRYSNIVPIEEFYCYLQSGDTVLDKIPETVEYNLPIKDATIPSFDFIEKLNEDCYDVVTLTNIAGKPKIRYSIQPSGKYGTLSTSSHACIYVVNTEIVYLNTSSWAYLAFVSGSNPSSGGDLMLVDGESVKTIGAGERYYKVPKDAKLLLICNTNGVYPDEIKLFNKKEVNKQPIKPVVEYNNVRGTTHSSGVKGFVTRLEPKKKYNLFFKGSGSAVKYVKLIDDIPATTELNTQTVSVADKRIEITPTQSCYLEVTKSTGVSVLETVTVEEVIDDVDFKCEVNDFRSKAVQEASLSGLTFVNGQAIQEINVLKRAKQFTDIVWEPKSTFYGKTRDRVYTGGVVQRNGIPYSNNFTDYKIVGQTVSIHTFMTAINNPYSMIYTERVKDGDSESVWGRTYYGPNGYAYYGAVCCSFTSWCHGFKGNLGNPGYIWFSRYFGLTKAYDIRGKFDFNLLRVGDVLNSWKHAVIITGITRGENGEVTKIHLAECGGEVGNVGGCHVFPNTPTQFKTTMRTSATDPMDIMTLYRANGLYRNTEYTPTPYVVLDGETAQTVVYNNDICTVYGDKASLAEGYKVVLNYDLDGNHSDWTAIEVYKDDALFGTYLLSGIDQSALPEGQRGHALDLGDELTAGMYKARMTDGTNYSDYTYWEIVSNDVDVESLGEGKYHITNNTGKEMIDCVIGIYRRDALGMERADISYPLKLEDIQANQFTMNLRAWLQATNKSVALPYVIKLVLQGEYTGVATAVIQLPDIDY